jgi:hypothetical protein
MEPEEIKESLERVEEALHETEEKVKSEEKESKWMSYIALSTAIIAVVAAVVGLFSNQATSETILSKNEAILFQSQASDAWAFFQAKGIKEQIYAVNAKTAAPAAARAFKQEADRYAQEKAEIQKKAESLEKQVEAKNKESEHFYGKHHVFEYAETFLHVAIALAAISALTRNRPFWLLSILLAGVGTVYFSLGLFR